MDPKSRGLGSQAFAFVRHSFLDDPGQKTLHLCEMSLIMALREARGPETRPRLVSI